MGNSLILRGVMGAVFLAASSAMAAAQTPAEFYKGKTIQFGIGYGPGSGYDLYARMVARFIGKHIPGNPSVVVNNMPGAGSVKLANYLYNVAKKDGTEIGATSRGMAFYPLLGGQGTKYDADKFTWLGSANDEVSLCVATKKSGVTSIEDVKKKPLTVGSTGQTDDTSQFPKILNGVLGTKFKIVLILEAAGEVGLIIGHGREVGREPAEEGEALAVECLGGGGVAAASRIAPVAQAPGQLLLEPGDGRRVTQEPALDRDGVAEVGLGLLG